MFMKEIAKELFKNQLSTEDSKLEAQLLNGWWIELSCTLHKGRAMFSLSRSFRILERNQTCVNMLTNLV